MTLEFTSSSTRLYTIQHTDDLLNPNSWSDSGLGSLVGSTGSTTRSFAIPGTTKRYFRIHAQRPLND